MRRTGPCGGRESANVRNGSRPKTVLTAATGPVEIEVPWDRDGSFESVIAHVRQPRLTEVDEVVLSLSARELTTGEISAHFAQIYGASVSKETISRITDRVVEEMVEWQNRPLEEVYAAVFIDAISRPSVRFVGGASAARRIGGRLAFNRTSSNAGEGALRAIRLASLGCDESHFDVRGAP
jgi:transposase-like protein